VPGVNTSRTGISSSRAVSSRYSFSGRAKPSATSPPEIGSASWSTKSIVSPALSAVRTSVWFWRPFHMAWMSMLGLAASNASIQLWMTWAWGSVSFHIDQ